MTTFDIRLVLSATDKLQSSGAMMRTYRASYRIVRGSNHVGGVGVATLVTQPDAPLSIEFEGDGPAKTMVRMVSDYDGVQHSAVIGTVVFDDSVPPDAFSQFAEAMESAFFDAINALVVHAEPLASAAQPAAGMGVVGIASTQAEWPTPTGVVAMPHPVVMEQGKKGMRQFFVRRNVVGLGLLLGAATTVYGVTVARQPANPLKAAMHGESYEDLQAQIRAQISAAAKSDVPLLNGKADGLGGQNIAIETMKSMGLDPGKANAGCLVGVQ